MKKIKLAKPKSKSNENKPVTFYAYTREGGSGNINFGCNPSKNAACKAMPK